MLLLPEQNRKKLPTMRLIINLVLLAIVAALIYVLIDSIREPIAFKNERAKFIIHHYHYTYFFSQRFNSYIIIIITTRIILARIFKTPGK